MNMGITGVRTAMNMHGSREWDRLPSGVKKGESQTAVEPMKQDEWRVP
jgi:hypothetical protein